MKNNYSPVVIFSLFIFDAIVGLGATKESMSVCVNGSNGQCSWPALSLNAA